MNKEEAIAIVRAGGLRNPFRDRTMRQEWDACVFMYETKHRNLFINGERRRQGSYGSSLASGFWQGYDHSITADRFDRPSRQTLHWAHWRAGRMLAERDQKGAKPMAQALPISRLILVAARKLSFAA